MIDCDELRRNYHEWTPAEHRAFYSRLYAEYPDQSHHAPDLCSQALKRARPRRVVELGGWDGELAARMLDGHPDIEQWTNVELCREAALENPYSHPRLVNVCPDGWFWDEPRPGDMLVSSHCIEHLSGAHLDLAIGAVPDARWLWFDAPLLDGPTNWWGTTTTHVLECGWDGVSVIARGHGFELVEAVDHVLPPESGGYARACLYERR